MQLLLFAHCLLLDLVVLVDFVNPLQREVKLFLGVRPHLRVHPVLVNADFLVEFVIERHVALGPAGHHKGPVASLDHDGIIGNPHFVLANLPSRLNNVFPAIATIRDNRFEMWMRYNLYCSLGDDAHRALRTQKQAIRIRTDTPPIECLRTIKGPRAGLEHLTAW